ncbi:hypothetical protein BCR39DRAFT_554824 [Naematelia encephala]|uniref:N-terminal Ras-GEF domain-containing protein n=1 Tax=Naematelia encephala TaxID=71784 RepID=A0A1Y2ADV2_9TREE|nr:hypothetical protein BCR39DRAFT_554824 [Naematelia encephala]
MQIWLMVRGTGVVERRGQWETIRQDVKNGRKSFISLSISILIKYQIDPHQRSQQYLRFFLLAFKTNLHTAEVI